ncbi:hypothetical protein [Paraburkholderia humisilvae]|uniref:Uncharacterized protein n=1 Tax=Paraburkholderia humisilvae TaxID=627669 RepID=A0A6J5DKY5_9BURK|nr:hypothetical protein [Paraburkholderia humisilvae]CAB3754849.1 hypothetical protein LMG29542_02469 [Paraburkholderia humisilvae]
MLEFTIGDKREVVTDSLIESFYGETGIGRGEVDLAQVRAFFVARCDRLQPSDIVTDYEKELSRLSYALYLASERGIKIVTVN